jgi:hypothetical protein
MKAEEVAKKTFEHQENCEDELKLERHEPDC